MKANYCFSILFGLAATAMGCGSEAYSHEDSANEAATDRSESALSSDYNGKIKVTNTGSMHIVVMSIYVKCSWYSLGHNKLVDADRTTGVSLAPGASHTFSVTYAQKVESCKRDFWIEAVGAPGDHWLLTDGVSFDNVSLDLGVTEAFGLNCRDEYPWTACR